MKQPNPIKNPFVGQFISPYSMQRSGKNGISIKEMEKVHAWLGRVIVWMKSIQPGVRE